jgi:predicted enzyme related to lactoylglutathione lyase
VFETALIVPSWTAAPPASLQLLQGPYGLDFKAFWITFHSLHELTFLAAIVTCWRLDPVRRPLLALFAAHMGVRIWTIAYFAPTIIAFQHLPPSATVDPSLVASAALWRNLNYLRVGVFVAISLALLPLIGRVVTLLYGPKTSERSAAMSASDAGAHVHHAIDYIEFAVKDVSEAKRFYAAAFGWTFNDYGPDYAGIQGQGREAGGLRKDADVRVGGPLVVLYSRTLDDTLRKVKEAGGRIVKEPFSFPGGRRFHFSDPSGNELAVWSEA